MSDGKRLQMILLKHFEGEKYKQGHITSKLTKVIDLKSSLYMNSSNGLGAISTKHQGLWLFPNILWKNVFEKSNFDHCID